MLAVGVHQLLIRAPASPPLQTNGKQQLAAQTPGKAPGVVIMREDQQAAGFIGNEHIIISIIIKRLILNIDLLPFDYDFCFKYNSYLYI